MEKRGEFQPAAPIAEKQSRSIGLVLAVVFLALCTVVLGALYCYERFIAKDNGSAIADTSGSKDCDAEAEEKIDGVEKTEILGIATADTDLQVRTLIKDAEKAWNKATRSYAVDKIYGESGPMIKLESGNWAEASKFYGLVASDWDNIGSNAIAEALTDNGLVRDDKYRTEGREGWLYYVSDDIVCSLYDSLTNRKEYHLSCAHKEWISDSDEALVDGLIKAYNEKAEEKIDYLYGARAEKIAKKDDGYQTIEASVGDAAAMFYRKGEDSEWKFFAATQGVLMCDAYDTDELRAAYSGEPCYENNAESVVK